MRVNSRDVENNIRSWDQLTPEEQSDLSTVYQRQGKYLTGISRALSDILFNWIFILNSGGLIGVATIYAGYHDDNSVRENAWYMGICFAVGLILIYFSAQLEKIRTNKKGRSLDINFDLLQIRQISVAQFLNLIHQDIFPWGKMINLIEFLSFIAFCAGLYVGFFRIL